VAFVDGRLEIFNEISRDGVLADAPRFVQQRRVDPAQPPRDPRRRDFSAVVDFRRRSFVFWSRIHHEGGWP
jgi:hypothetical protein